MTYVWSSGIITTSTAFRY